MALRFLLDTNIASFLIKETNPALDRRVRLISSHELAISVITEAEIRFGLALLPSEAKVHDLARRFLDRVHILPWDSPCAQTYAELAARQRRTGQTLDTPDAMIAAHALAYDLVLVSNDSVFRFVENLRLEDWTKGPQPA